MAKIVDGRVDLSGKSVSIKKNRRIDRFDDKGRIDLTPLFSNAVWLFRDQRLNSIVDKRLFSGYRGGAIEFSTDIEFSFNAKLAAKLQTTIGKLGLDAEFGFKQVGKIKIDMDFEFYPFIPNKSELQKLRREKEKLCDRRLQQLKAFSVEL